jgi:hypothetical protein
MLFRRMMRILLVGLSIPTAVSAMQYVKVNQRQLTEDEAMISRLKNTPMGKLEAGLPDQRFDAWFAERRKDTEIRYEAEACDDVYSRTPYAGKGPLKCVTAISVQGIGSELVLRFVAAVPGKDGKLKTVDCIFLGGSEGPPPGSPMKRPTREISRLSDFHRD